MDLLREFGRRLEPFAMMSVLLPLFVYLLTLAPSVTFFDSGEFITAASCLGSAHSPGYPLFLNYAKPFTWLPFGNVAFRINFATAVSGALACYGVYLLVCHLLANEDLGTDERFASLLKRGIGLVSALTFAFSARLWLQSNHDKPYPLVSFIAAIVFYLVLRWRDSYLLGEERPAYVYMGAFLCGLATAAHQTIILMVPAYAFLIISRDWRIVTRIRDLLIAFACALLGFSINLYLPLRATRNPLLNWGDPKSLEQFLWHFLRKGYPVEKPARDSSLLWSQINAFNVPHEFTTLGLLLLVIGLVFFFRRRRDEVIAYGLGLVSFLLVIVGYFNTPSDLIFLTEEFFSPLYLLSAVFVGVGMFVLIQTGFARLPVHQMCSVPMRILSGLILLVLPTTVCAVHYLENDQHLNYIAYDYASNTLRSAPQGAVLYTWGDSGAFPLWYLQGLERMRDDLDVLHTPHLVFSWYLDSFPQLFQNSMLRHMPLESQSPENVLLLSVMEQYPRRPVLIDFSTRYSVPFTNYRLLQRGITYQLVTGQTDALLPPELTVFSRYTQRGMAGGELFFRDLDTGKAILIYASTYLEAGETLLKLGRKGEGVAYLRVAERISPELAGQVNQLLMSYGVR
ncbi:MAG TPA: DUF2723 domain-containing protein [Geobacteraceae bacterium]